jgi:hypothetical protein
LFCLTPSAFADPDPNFYVFLCFGQSNMDGSGRIGQQDRTVDEGFQVMAAVDMPDLDRKKGRWYPAVPPLSRSRGGLGPADYFGRTMVANLPENIKVGVINVAVPGCKIELFERDTFREYTATAPSWMTGFIKGYDDNPYQTLVDLGKLAQKDGVIKDIRQRQVQVRVLNEQGRPVPGVKVEVKQTSKAFPFGAALTPTVLRDRKYQEFFLAHFNYAVCENAMKWYSNEGRRGREDYSRADAMLAWCKEHDVPMRGHCVFWEPEKWQSRWLRELDVDDLRAAVKQRVDSIIRRYRGKIIEWDVDNEMLHASFFKDRRAACSSRPPSSCGCSSGGLRHCDADCRSWHPHGLCGPVIDLPEMSHRVANANGFRSPNDFVPPPQNAERKGKC